MNLEDARREYLRSGLNREDLQQDDRPLRFPGDEADLRSRDRSLTDMTAQLDVELRYWQGKSGF